MSAIQGAIPVTGFLGPTDSLDTYAVTDAIYGIDGYRSVSAITARNTISTERRREGMLVYTQDDQNVWQLLPAPWSGINADWKLFISSAATASLSGASFWSASTGANSIIANNNTGNIASGLNSTILGGTGHTISGRNSSIIGGGSINGSANDTVYMPNVRLAEMPGTKIFSANTDLYNIFMTPAGVAGNFLSLGGGTVTGNTVFTTSITANTLALTTTNTAAPLNFPIFITDPVSPHNGDVWILSGSNGNALLNVRIGGVTKTVELS